MNAKAMYFLNGNIWEKIYSWYQGSLIRELLEYFNTTVFGVEFGVYDNFSVESGLGATVRSLIFGLMLGTIFAGALMYYTKNVHGKFVRVLLKNECFTPEKAMTLRETGMFRSPSVRRELAKNGVLAKLTKRVCATSAAKSTEADGEAADAPKEPTEEPTVDFLKDRFYIPEELKYKAEVRYDKSGSERFPFAITVIACVILAFLLCRFMPTLLGLADWLISALAPA